MLFPKSPQHRRFEYQPRFAQPDRRERMRFQRKTLFQPRAGKNPLYYLALLIIFLLIYLFLKGGNFSLIPEKLKISTDDAVILQ